MKPDISQELSVDSRKGKRKVAWQKKAAHRSSIFCDLVLPLFLQAFLNKTVIYLSIMLAQARIAPLARNAVRSFEAARSELVLLICT